MVIVIRRMQNFFVYYFLWIVSLRNLKKCETSFVFYFRTIDQFANLVLHETLERIHVDKYYGDIQRGVFLIRGENVVLAGEIDETKEQSSGLLNFYL